MKKISEKEFIKYFEKNHPDKMKFNPKIIEIIGENVIFGMKKHQGSFCVNLSMFRGDK